MTERERSLYGDLRATQKRLRRVEGIAAGYGRVLLSVAENPDKAFEQLPCFDFPGSSCFECDGTGLWCVVCSTRRERDLGPPSGSLS